MKKITKIFLLMALVCTLIVCGMMSAGALSSKGKCGKDVSYTYDKKTGALVISGSGAMYDYDYYTDNKSPFEESDIKSVTIKKGVTRVGDSAFHSCESLKKVTIADTVKVIGEDAFSYCESLTSVKLPKNLERINYRGFYCCRALETITLPEKLKNIGGSAFCFCSALKSIDIPDSVTQIGAEAFYSCSNIETVEIGRAVKKIGTNAFGFCEELKEIAVDKNNKYFVVENGALSDKAKTKILKYPSKNTNTEYVMPDTVKTISEGAFSSNTYLEKVTLSANLEKIGIDAFFWCEKLKSITIPEKVSVIRPNAFHWCCALEEIKVDKKNETYSAVNGVLFNKDKSTLIKYPEGKTTKFYAVPVSVINISDYAFYDADFEKVIIDKNVETIGENAFNSCDNLRDITIPGNVREIGRSAFINTSNLKTVIMKPGVEFIGEGAFSNCINLTELEIGAGIDCIDAYAFEECEKLSKVTFNGTKAQWNDIEIREKNDYLTKASVKFVDNCNCHKSGFMGFIYKIELAFWKLFKSNKVCICGIAHY